MPTSTSPSSVSRRRMLLSKERATEELSRHGRTRVALGFPNSYGTLGYALRVKARALGLLLPSVVSALTLFSDLCEVDLPGITQQFVLA